MPGKNTVELRFIGGAADPGDLDAAITSVLDELTNPASAAAESAGRAGLDPSDLVDATVSVRKDSKGFGVVALVIVVAAPVAAHIVEKFWDEVIWPRIKDRLGADAVGKRDE